LAPSWLALRAGPLEMGEEPDLFFFGALDLPEPWVAKARADGHVLVCFGPCTNAPGEIPETDEDLDLEVLDELIEDRTLVVRRVPVAAEGEPAAALAAG
jgi:hypothetical protein